MGASALLFEGVGQRASRANPLFWGLLLIISYVQSDDAAVTGTFECDPDRRFWSMDKHNFILAKDIAQGEEFYLRCKRVRRADANVK